MHPHINGYAFSYSLLGQTTIGIHLNGACVLSFFWEEFYFFGGVLSLLCSHSCLDICMFFPASDDAVILRRLLYLYCDVCEFHQCAEGFIWYCSVYLCYFYIYETLYSYGLGFVTSYVYFLYHIGAPCRRSGRIALIYIDFRAAYWSPQLRLADLYSENTNFVHFSAM